MDEILRGVTKLKIENGYNKYLQNIKQTQKQSTSKMTDQAFHSKQDKNIEISISEEAKKLSEVSQKELYSERVQKIKAAIQNGSYEIKPKEISESIMREIKAQKGSEE